MEHKKLIHEQEFESYGIDPKEVYKETSVLKSIPKEWIGQIIEKTITTCSPRPVHINKNDAEKVFIVFFDSNHDCELFRDDFNKKIMPCINQFIMNQNENPSIYNRMLVLETVLDSLSFSIRY
jgi:hypothetical protein